MTNEPPSPHPHLRRELDRLAREATDERNTITDRVSYVLSAHQRFDVGGCLCGWNELGKSHPRHVADALNDVGLLTADEPKGRP